VKISDFPGTVRIWEGDFLDPGSTGPASGFKYFELFYNTKFKSLKTSLFIFLFFFSFNSPGSYVIRQKGQKDSVLGTAI
jgi:hypothetical protein